jgi:hypothetical protein
MNELCPLEIFQNKVLSNFLKESIRLKSLTRLGANGRKFGPNLRMTICLKNFRPKWSFLN